MKIKSIAAICKKNKNIAIFERYSDDGDILTQYIGDGSAVYPVVGLPQLDKESLLTIFDVPEKDRDNYFVKTLGVPAGISFEDTDETERHVEREGISIIYSGRTLKPIRTTRGLVFIESRYLSPVADVLDVLELYERRTAEGAPYIVAKAGFLLQAVIMPYDVINQQFVESLRDLTRECEFSLSEKERREREARDRFTFTEPEQCSLNVDPDTGEVVEESEVADNAYIHITKNSQGMEEIEVQGKFLLSWIGKRILTTQIITKDTTQNILYAIVKQTCTNAGAARNIPNFSISTTDADTGSGQIDYTSEQYANAQLAAETAAKAAKLGIRVLTNARTGKHTFSVYEGRDLTAGNTAGNAPCIFSQEFDNIVEQEYTNSVENLKTTAYVSNITGAIWTTSF